VLLLLLQVMLAFHVLYLVALPWARRVLLPPQLALHMLLLLFLLM
jgi:hypothetical protein